jgi:hypothetical protein
MVTVTDVRDPISTFIRDRGRAAGIFGATSPRPSARLT